MRVARSIVVSLILGSLAASALAQSPGKCQMPGCEGIWFGPVVRPPAPSFTPDRRPAIVIGTFSGGEPRPLWDPGLTPWWADDRDSNGDGLSNAMENLLARLDAAYADGWRRFILNRPGGDAIGNKYQATPQFWTQPAWKRAEILDKQRGLAWWIDQHRDLANPLNDVSVGLFGGFRLNGDPCWLGDAGGLNLRILKTSLQPDMCEFWLNNWPWLQAGLREFWFDNAGGRDIKAGKPSDVADKLAAMMDLPHAAPWANFPSLTLGAEPMYIKVKEGSIPDPIANAWVPTISGHAFLSRQALDPHKPAPWPPEWTFDPHSTSVNLWVKLQDIQEEGFTIDTAYRYVQHGFILWAWVHDLPVEIVKRIYDFGTIKCPADLNLDGVVNEADFAKLAAFYYQGVPNPIPYYHGDLNRDGVLDGSDFMLLAASMGACPP